MLLNGKTAIITGASSGIGMLYRNNVCSKWSFSVPDR